MPVNARQYFPEVETQNYLTVPNFPAKYFYRLVIDEQEHTITTTPLCAPSLTGIDIVRDLFQDCFTPEIEHLNR